MNHMDHQTYPQTHTFAKGSGPVISRDPNITDEERKIREKLEEEVERGLEDEIKDGIYRLALRLGRLYEAKKERTMKSKQGNNCAPSEVNISIKMDGGTKVEIRETKSEARVRRLAGSRCGMNGTRLDWAKSLRSKGVGSVRPGSVDVVKKREPFRFG